MTSPKPDRLSARARWALIALAWAALIAVVHGFDRWGVGALASDRIALLEGRDWYRALRVQGHWPVWGAAGCVMLLAAAARRRVDVRDADAARWWAPGLLLIASTGLAGLMAEGLKLLIRRGRPEAGEAYVFFDWLPHGWDPGEYGLPSSHAAVAFAAAFSLAICWPRTLWLMLPLAAACGWTRLLAGQHFVSDVAAAALVGFLAPRLVIAGHGLWSRSAGGGGG